MIRFPYFATLRSELIIRFNPFPWNGVLFTRNLYTNLLLSCAAKRVVFIQFALQIVTHDYLALFTIPNENFSMEMLSVIPKFNECNGKCTNSFYHSIQFELNVQFFHRKSSFSAPFLRQKICHNSGPDAPENNG